MLEATVKFLNQGHEPVNGYIIEGMQDVQLLRNHLNGVEQRVAEKFIKSNEPVYRYSHVLGDLRGFEKAMGKLAVARGALKESNSIFEIESASCSWMNTLISILSRGYQVFVNEKGGMCPIDDNLKIVKYNKVGKIETPVMYKITMGSKVINLENSWELEDVAIKYMVSNYNSYSYITEFRFFQPYCI